MIISTYLGNPGKKYEATRHNLAWIMLEYTGFAGSLNWNAKFKAKYARLANPESIHLKPETLMNLSGESAAAALGFFKLAPGSMIVVHDDLELPFGTVQLKKGGGTGGHNGLRSIVKLTGSPDFFRFRMGISRPPAGRDVASWVLSRFSEDEEALLPDYCRLAAAYFETILRNGPVQGEKRVLVNF